MLAAVFAAAAVSAALFKMACVYAPALIIIDDCGVYRLFCEVRAS